MIINGCYKKIKKKYNINACVNTHALILYFFNAKNLALIGMIRFNMILLKGIFC